MKDDKKMYYGEVRKLYPEGLSGTVGERYFGKNKNILINVLYTDLEKMISRTTPTNIKFKLSKTRSTDDLTLVLVVFPEFYQTKLYAIHLAEIKEVN